MLHLTDKDTKIPEVRYFALVTLLIKSQAWILPLSHHSICMCLVSACSGSGVALSTWMEFSIIKYQMREPGPNSVLDLALLSVSEVRT